MNKLIEILNCDAKWGIGRKNGLLFSLPKDMAFFKQKTMGHVVAMGENTLLSFPKSQPLKGRVNIVLSKDGSYSFDNVVNVHSFEDFLKEIHKNLQNGDVFVVGGASIYRQMLPYCDEVWLTKVKEDGNAEVFFENLDEKEEWALLSQSPLEEDNGHIISFCVYVNNSKKNLQ